MAIIGVMGSGKDAWENLSIPLGVWIARSGHHLLTGAGQGVMASVARAFCSVPDRAGHSIGIVPTQPDELHGFVALPGYPNDYIDIPIVTPLSRKMADAPPQQLSRNHVNILTSNIVVALPGGPGTRDEINLGLRFGKPLVGFGRVDDFHDVPSGLCIISSLDELAGFVAAQLACA